MGQQKIISIGIADDHVLLRKGLIKLLTPDNTYQCLFDVNSGAEVIEQMKLNRIPDVLVLDVNMPDKDGPATAQWVKQYYPFVKILALSMYNDENNIMNMIQAGAHGYITKNSEPEKLKEAINRVYEKGVYLPETLYAKLFSGIHKQNTGQNKVFIITEREKEFLALLCRELTYQQIAEKMFLSPRTIEGYRKTLARKLNVKGRSGLIVYAINHGLT